MQFLQNLLSLASPLAAGPSVSHGFLQPRRRPQHSSSRVRGSLRGASAGGASNVAVATGPVTTAPGCTHAIAVATGMGASPAIVPRGSQSAHAHAGVLTRTGHTGGNTGLFLRLRSLVPRKTTTNIFFARSENFRFAKARRREPQRVRRRRQPASRSARTTQPTRTTRSVFSPQTGQVDSCCRSCCPVLIIHPQTEN